MERPPVFVVGRLPPPLDGQTLATERLCTLLDPTWTVRRVDTSVREVALQATETRFRPGRAWHYLRLRSGMRRALAAAPCAPVLWASVSPHPLGHLRDAVATVPAFGPDQPVVAVSHRAYFERMFESPVTRRSAERLVERLSAVVFLTAGIAERAARWVPPEKRLVIPNTVGEDLLFSASDVHARQARATERPVLRLLFLANMMPEKGYMDALSATGLLHARGVAVSLVLIGRWMSEADRRAFEARTDALGLRGIVDHLGGVSDRMQVRRALSDADVLLFPSYHPSEAQPVAVIEALGAGTPVVAVAHGGLPEMITDGHEGFLVPARSPAALADAAALLCAPATWHAASVQARARFDAAYSPDAVCRQWTDLLAALG